MNSIVSIHAPARGATLLGQCICGQFFVSIHAPARGATAAIPIRGTWSICFNPRARAGRDRGPRLFLLFRTMFQSTRPRGARPMSPNTSLLAAKFQSTRPRGARPPDSSTDQVPTIVSIHAPARGATRTVTPHSSASLFQSTRPRGARQALSDLVSTVIGVSIHAPARGATTFFITPEIIFSFQSTRPRGARRWQGESSTRMECFNPRARAGRDNHRRLLIREK